MSESDMFEDFDDDNVRIVNLRVPSLAGMNLAQIAGLFEGVATHILRQENLSYVVPEENQIVGGVLVGGDGQGFFPFSLIVGEVLDADNVLFEDVVNRARNGERGVNNEGQL